MRTLHVRFLRIALFFLVLFGLAACKSPYEIVEPADGSVYTSVPAVFKIRYETLPDPFPRITLNGIIVNSFFTFGPTEAVAQGPDLAPYLIQGKNTLQVDPAFGPKVEFTYDTTGPGVVVLSADSQDPNTINGMLIDTAGVKSLFINGVSTVVGADGSFTVSVPAADVYTFDAVDKLDTTSQTKYGRLGLNNNPILGMRVNQGAIDVALSGLVNILNGTDLNAMMAGTKIFSSTSKGLAGELYGSEATLDSISLSAESFKFTLGDQGNSSFAGTMTNAHAVLTLKIYNGLLPPTSITIGAELGPIDFSADIQMAVANKVPKIVLSNMKFHIGAIVLDNTPAVFNAIISPVSSGLVNLVGSSMSGLISKTVSSLLAKTVSQMIVDSYTVSLYGRDMSAVLQPEQLTTSSGSLIVAMSGAMAPGTVDPLVAQPLGALYTPDVLPAPSATAGDFSLDINTNFINQALASAHAIGLTQVNTVTTTATGAKTNQFGLPHDDSIGVDGDTRTLIEMQTAPQIQVSRIGTMASAKMYIHGLKMIGQKKVSGVWKNAYRVRLNVVADVKLSVGADNLLQFTVASVPNINVIGAAIGDGAELPGFINEQINQFAQLGIGYVLEQLSAPLTNLKLPSLLCMSMNFNQVEAVGDHNTHLDLSGTLVKTSDSCDISAAPPPKVAYDRGVGVPMGCGSEEEYDAGLCYTPCRYGYDGVGPVCWKQEASYGRGVGTVPTSACASGKVMDAGLCYTPCKAGFHGVLNVCYNDLALSYGRGVGTIPNLIPYGCPSGKEMDAGLCYVPCSTGYHGVGPVCWLNEPSYDRGIGTIPPQTCGAGQEMDAGLCYPVCSSGYHGVGPVCWTNDALSYGRGVGAPVHTCQAGKELDAGLCYDSCDTGFNGVGPTCWPQK